VPKNAQWAKFAGIGRRDIGIIEREWLDVLDYQLGFTADDILACA
jgi:hypothetical protein